MRPTPRPMHNVYGMLSHRRMGVAAPQEDISVEPDFPASAVVSSFRRVERMLNDVVEVLPYSDEHLDVWSPYLVTILLEACSQLDSLWKAKSRQTGSGSKDPKITDYFASFGSDVAHRWLVFWGEQGRRVQPFAPWIGAATYKPLEWWQAYNNVKHDRLANRTQAKLRHAVDAVAGLFIAILRSPECAAAVAHEGWIVPSPGALGIQAEDLLSDHSSVRGIVVESVLLSHPVKLGWKPGPPRHTMTSVRGGSDRFRSWCAQHGLVHWEA